MLPVISRAALHHWEEPCIAGSRGAGTVFFAGCNLSCVYCQNYEISEMRKGIEVSVERLREIYFELIDEGAHNIDLVTPTHYTHAISRACGTRSPCRWYTTAAAMKACTPWPSLETRCSAGCRI